MSRCACDPPHGRIAGARRHPRLETEPRPFEEQQHPRRPRGRSRRQGKVKTGERKWRRRKEEPLGPSFQTAEVILNSDWCQKFFVFFWPIRGQQAVKSFRVFLHGNHLIAILALVRLARFCSRRKVSITTQNIQGIVRNIGGEIRWTFRRYWYGSVFPSVRDLFKDVLTDSLNKIAAITFDLTIIFILPPNLEKFLIARATRSTTLFQCAPN